MIYTAVWVVWWSIWKNVCQQVLTLKLLITQEGDKIPSKKLLLCQQILSYLNVWPFSRKYILSWNDKENIFQIFKDKDWDWFFLFWYNRYTFQLRQWLDKTDCFGYAQCACSRTQIAQHQIFRTQCLSSYVVHK